MNSTSNIIEIDMSTETSFLHKSAYYQYDEGLMVRLTNVPELEDCTLKVEMCNAGDKVIKHDCAYSGGDVEIPADLLQEGRNVQIYLFIVGSNWGKTILTIDLHVSRRPSR